MNNILSVKIYTCATDKNKVKHLVNTATKNNWDIEVLTPIFDGNWKNIYKIFSFYEALKICTSNIVILLDAYDTLVNCTPKECIDYIISINGLQKIIIGDESKYKTPSILKNFINLPIKKSTGSNDYNLGLQMGNPSFKHNTGIIIGNTKKILLLFSHLINEYNKNPVNSDQRLIGNTACNNSSIIKDILLTEYCDDSLWHVGINPTVYDLRVENSRIILPNNNIPLFIHRTRNQHYRDEWNYLLNIIYLSHYDKINIFPRILLIIKKYIMEIFF
jgi:hypothetical protein